jgi:hypothetical protein
LAPWHADRISARAVEPRRHRAEVEGTRLFEVRKFRTTLRLAVSEPTLYTRIGNRPVWLGWVLI